MKFEIYFFKKIQSQNCKKTLHRIGAFSMLHHHFKLQKNPIRTLGREGFQSLEMEIFFKFTKIWILRKAGKSLHRIEGHYVVHHCAKFEEDPISSFGEEGIWMKTWRTPDEDDEDDWRHQPHKISSASQRLSGANECLAFWLRGTVTFF